MITHVAFDFDGTLVKSIDVMIELYNKWAEEYNYKKIHQENVDQLIALSFRDRCKALGVPFYKLPAVVMYINKNYSSMLRLVTCFEGVKSLMQTLHNRGINIGIISSNNEDNIRNFLINNEMDQWVDRIFCSSNLFGKDKMLAKYLKLHNISPTQILYVGDEQRDIVACKKCNIPIAVVSWGYDDNEIIQEANPDFFVSHPEEIIHCIEQLRVQI